MHCQVSKPASSQRPQARLLPCRRQRYAEPKPATTASNRKTTSTWRRPASRFTPMVITRMATAAAPGANDSQGLWPAVPKRAQRPNPDKTRNGTGVLTRMPSRKKYHHPPLRIFPRRYAGEALWFATQASASPRSNDGAGTGGSRRIISRAIFPTGLGKCWNEGMDCADNCMSSLTGPTENLYPPQRTITAIAVAKASFVIQRVLTWLTAGSASRPRRLQRSTASAAAGRNRRLVNFDNRARPNAMPSNQVDRMVGAFSHIVK